MINPVWLRTFVTLVDVGHFTKTAQQLFMTQSGVSQHVKKLEQTYSVDLLIRQGKGFQLTTAGNNLYQEAKFILQSMENLERKLVEDSPYEGQVKLMSPGSVGLKLYPHLLSLQGRHPQLVVDYRFSSNQDIEQRIKDDKIDFGLMTMSAKSADLISSKMAQEALLLVLPAGEERVDWPLLQNLGFIGHPDGEHHANLLLSENYNEFRSVEQFKQKGFSNQITLILEPVAMGIGFTVLPSYAVSAFAKQDQIRVVTLPKPVYEPLYLVQRRGRHQPSCVDFCRNEVNTILINDDLSSI